MCHSCHIFIKKTSVEANVNVVTIFTHRFVRNCSEFVSLWQLRTLHWFVNNVFVLDIRYFYTQSWAVKSSPRNPWIEGSNPGGNYTYSSVSRRINLFPPKTVLFVPLRGLSWRLHYCAWINKVTKNVWIFWNHISAVIWGWVYCIVYHIKSFFCFAMPLFF